VVRRKAASEARADEMRRAVKAELELRSVDMLLDEGAGSLDYMEEDRCGERQTRV
jgi:hypothetical protein